MEAECESLITIQEVADRDFTSPRILQEAIKKYSKVFGELPSETIKNLRK